MRRWMWNLVVVAAVAALSGCGYNKLQEQDEAVSATWSALANLYQRRADLIPNLVHTVRGYAAQEERALVGVTEARARVTSIELAPELLNDPEAFKRYQAAQGEITAALKTLLATVENYPQLKSDAVFRDLMVQLEGTESRITVARNRYIDAVKAFNVTVRSFPSNLTAKMFDFDAKPNFSIENERAISTAHSVSFDMATQRQSAPVAAPDPATPAAAN